MIMIYWPHRGLTAINTNDFEKSKKCKALGINMRFQVMTNHAVFDD
jgi:hypothetical protein